MLEWLVLCKNSDPEVGTSLFQQHMCPKGEHNLGLQRFEASWPWRGRPCLLCGGLQESERNLTGDGRSTRQGQRGWVPPAWPSHPAALRASWPQAAGSEQEQQEQGLEEEGLCRVGSRHPAAGPIRHVCTKEGTPWDRPGCHLLGWTTGGRDRQGTASVRFFLWLGHLPAWVSSPQEAPPGG